jgi:hypothetical protein
MGAVLVLLVMAGLYLAVPVALFAVATAYRRRSRRRLIVAE